MYKKYFVFIALFFTSLSVFSQTVGQPINQTIINNGIGLGSAIAVAISWSKNQSIFGQYFTEF